MLCSLHCLSSLKCAILKYIPTYIAVLLLGRWSKSNNYVKDQILVWWFVYFSNLLKFHLKISWYLHCTIDKLSKFDHGRHQLLRQTIFIYSQAQKGEMHTLGQNLWNLDSWTHILMREFVVSTLPPDDCFIPRPQISKTNFKGPMKVFLV